MAEGNILTYLEQSKEFNLMNEAIEKKVEDQIAFGLSGIQSVFFMAGLIKKAKENSIIITYSTQQGRKLTESLERMLPDETIKFFPSFETLLYDVTAYSNEISVKRMESIQSLLNGERITVVVPIGTLIECMADPGKIQKNSREIKIGDIINLERTIGDFVKLGYERVNQVEGKGQFSIRGGIIDVFPLASLQPIRMELFDDEVDSIRTFDIINQRSNEKVDEVIIYPAKELILENEDWQRGLVSLKSQIQHQEKRLIKQGRVEVLNKFKEKFSQLQEKVAEKLYFDGMQSLTSVFLENKFSLLQYFPKPPLIIFDEPSRMKESEELLSEEWKQKYVELLEKGEVLPNQVELHKLEDILNKTNTTKVGFSLLPKKVPYLNPRHIVSIAAKNIPVFMGKINLFAEELKAWKKAKFNIIIFAESEVRSKKIRNILEDYELGLSQVSIIQGSLPQGFELTNEKLVFITEKDIFGQSKKKLKKVPRKGQNKRAAFTDISDLKVGDYVVHANHGIGKYLGIERLEIGGIHKEYLSIKYHGEDRLYVPTEQIGLIQRYLGAEGNKPKVNRLGGSEWAKVRTRAMQSVEALADDLLKLYAARETVPGYGFAKDTVWQKDFEEAFPYEETSDQLKAIDEIKENMESPKPMERLLCGDVGYGKTEVALRAAFKAVMDGKQVAILVPTTILAQQHYNTCMQRFSGFPINIGMLSRFRSAKEQKDTIKKAGQGLVDILIGTHRLVQDDVKFKDLGLLIIDEEQRFGVTHKEKLKRIKETVDVIILTATPIPRTLYLSLTGARDMSVLETPPEERFPVQTYVAEFNPNMLRDAIEREIGRGGQVYFVHNRVQDIDKTAYLIQTLVPDAKVVIGHGQMKEEELEQVMVEFMKGEHDVLVCTTIIETGLDIPNVNTLIVDEADHMGLSQLYQLRGRVGRSNRTSYAYLTYKKNKVLSEIAEKRLQAIKEFTAFGSGFKIAMRDLEIRGAGNILGAEQHGHILSIGYELYCQLLEEAIAKVKGKPLPKEQNVSIELDIDAFIADDYIKEQSSKIEVYKKIGAVGIMEELQELEEELEDRYGDPPQALRNLLHIAKLKVIAKELGITTIQQKGEVIRLLFWDPNILSGEKLLALSRKFPRRIAFGVSEGLEIKISVKGLTKNKHLCQIEETFVEIKGLRTSKPL